MCFVFFAKNNKKPLKICHPPLGGDSFFFYKIIKKKTYISTKKLAKIQPPSFF